jgi:proprotein convertase subtilisin/kexin type 5
LFKIIDLFIIFFFLVCSFCKDLFPGCKNCDLDLKCKKCLDNYFFYNGSCYPNCRSLGKIIDFNSSLCTEKCPSFFHSFYDSTIDQTYCKICGENCEKCFDSVTCLYCESGWLLYNEGCVKNCPNNYFYIELERRCSSCPKGQYEITKNSKNCENCSPKCNLCFGDKDNCTSCNNEFLAFNGNCVSDCPPGTTIEISTKICANCHESCLECFGTSNSSCSKCASNLYFFEGTCIKNCPSGSFKNSENDSCSRCHYSCRNCFGPKEDQCKDDCKETRQFKLAFTTETTLGSPKGFCLCKDGFFERNVSDCAGKKLPLNISILFIKILLLTTTLTY